MFFKVKNNYRKLCNWAGAMCYAPSRAQANVLLFLFGVALLSIGLSQVAYTQAITITYNDNRIANSVNAVLTYIEGSFGALVMVSAGIGAIMAAAMGSNQQALALLVVSVGAFILRSVLATFFNDRSLRA